MPDSFVSPKMWRAHRLLLEDVLNMSDTNITHGKHLRQDGEFSQILRTNFNDIKRRNEAMLFKNHFIQQVPQLRSAVTDVKV